MYVSEEITKTHVWHLFEKANFTLSGRFDYMNAVYLEHFWCLSFQEDTIAKVMKHFGLPFQTARNSEHKHQAVLNKGTKNAVSDLVMHELDDFFEPFNQRLVQLLGEEKFLFSRE